jgi:hypothetical protein
VAKRVRLLIYEGTPEQLETQRQGDGIRQGTKVYPFDRREKSSLTITSVELDPTRMTLRELLRLFWTEIRHRASEGTLWPQ